MENKTTASEILSADVIEEEEDEELDHDYSYDYDYPTTASSGCDESRCVSKGGSSLRNGAFTCYGDNGRLFPRMCADGFLPFLVEDEPPISVPSPDEGDNNDVAVHYFTCCPPQHLSDSYNSPSSSSSSNITIYDDDMSLEAAAATRHCSDPFLIESESVDGVEPIAVCNENKDGRKHPRFMKPSARSVTISSGSKVVILEDSFQCCDAPAPLSGDGESQNFLEETDCVPYQNTYYESILAINKIGMIRPIVCNYPEDQNFLFLYPRAFDDDNSDAMAHRFRCCKEGPGLDPFVVDRVLKINTYPPIAINVVSILASAIMLLALCIPLFTEINRGILGKKSGNKGSSRSRGFGTKKNNQRQSSWMQSISDRIRRFSLMGLSSTTKRASSGGGGPAPSPRRRSRSRSESLSGSNRSGSRNNNRFSTYNLYLIILAILDLAHGIWALSWYFPKKEFNPDRHETTWYPSDIAHNPYNIGPTMSYVVSNMFLNSFIANQVLVLLRSSHRGRRIQQPTPKRIGIETAVTLVVGVAYWIFTENVLGRTWKASIGGDIETATRLDTIFDLSVYLLAFGPVVYVVGVTLWIWKRYLPPKPPPGTTSSPRRKATRELALYFFRIIAVFFGVWIPAFVFRFVLEGAFWDVFVPCFIASQPALTTAVVLTKTDVRNYVVDLVTLSCCCRRSTTTKTGGAFANTENAVRGSTQKSAKHLLHPENGAASIDQPQTVGVNNNNNNNNFSTKTISDITYSNVVIESRAESTASNNDNIDGSVGELLPNPQVESRKRCSLMQLGSRNFGIEEDDDDSDGSGIEEGDGERSPRSMEITFENESQKTVKIIFEKESQKSMEATTFEKEGHP